MLVPVAVYTELTVGDTRVDEPLVPLLQLYETAPEANIEPDALAQNTGGNVDKEITGSGFTVTRIVTVEVHPDVEELTPETVYSVVEEGETVIEALVAPVFHCIFDPAFVLKVIVSPKQIGFLEANAATSQRRVIIT
jgi:hypothetical protein